VSVTKDPHAITDDEVHYCSECGHVVGDGGFCPGCGLSLSEPGNSRRTASLGVGEPPSVPEHQSRRKAALIAVALIGVAAIVVAAVILSSGGGTDASATYKQKLAASLTPLVSANSQLSTSLVALSGRSTNAATLATSQAQTALTAARGAVGILTVPAGSAQLSQQTQQALTQEAGYLQVVGATLADPTSGTTSQLQTAAANAASAFVSLQAVVANAQASINGSDTLSSWARQQSVAAQRAASAAQHRQQQQAIARAARQAARQTPSATTTVIQAAPPTTQVPTSTLAPGTVTGTDGSGHNVGVSCSDNPTNTLPGCNDGSGRGPASNLSWGSVTGVDSAGFNTGVGCSDNPSTSLPWCQNP
jgi:hypothetical protein